MKLAPESHSELGNMRKLSKLEENHFISEYMKRVNLKKSDMNHFSATLRLFCSFIKWYVPLALLFNNLIFSGTLALKHSRIRWCSEILSI